MTHFQKLREKLQALPVRTLIEVVVQDVAAGKVTVVAASTGSGKSMLLPSALADQLNERVVVLVPRRFLATDAAYNVAELSETVIGEFVGYALGQMDGESSQRSEQTTLLYCTYGYALSSGLINKAQIVVLDEVHEADEYISLARAILRERKTKDHALRILEMSATVNAHAQARYWQDVATTSVHVVEGQALACDVLHEAPMLAGNKGRSAEEIVISLIENGRKGIVLFRPGVREVEESVETLKEQLAALSISEVEVVGIHGGTPSDERRIARRAPAEGFRKVIVGTNVIESGVNLRWLDAGVSDGYRKIPYHRDDTGAEALVREDQPQAGLLQQIGRINRDPLATAFEHGIYILHAKKEFAARLPQNGPAIQREGLNDIAFYAASLGYDPTKLTWDIASLPHANDLPARLEQAKQELMRLGLVHLDWSLTEEGGFIRKLPVSPETGAMICAARELDAQRMRKRLSPRVIRDIIIMAAVIESHGLRDDMNKGHKGDQHRTSDLLDAMNAYRLVRKEQSAEKVLLATEAVIAKASEDELEELQKDRLALQEVCEKHNVSLYGFIEIARLSDEIAYRLNASDKGIRTDPREHDDKYDSERYGELQYCLLSAGTNRLFLWENEGLRDLLRDFGKERSDAGAPYNGYGLSRSSIVAPPSEGDLLVGSLREIQINKESNASTLLVLTNVTDIPAEVFCSWVRARAENNQAILTDIALTAEGMLSCRYQGKANFEIKIPQQLRPAMKALKD